MRLYKLFYLGGEGKVSSSIVGLLFLVFFVCLFWVFSPCDLYPGDSEAAIADKVVQMEEPQGQIKSPQSVLLSVLFSGSVVWELELP